MAYNRWLAHHGVKGQKWGERNGPPYPLNSSISDGHKLIKSDGSPQSKKRYKTSEKTAHKRTTRKVKTIFVSGSSKTQDEASGYYRKELPKDIQKQLDEHMRKGNRIIVGDAPGIDRQVQDYLNSKKYQNVEVYGPGKEVRYVANSKWKTNPIDDPDHEPGSKEWLAKKDIAMTEAADEGLAIVLDEGAKATRKNVQRLSEGGKGVRVYSLNKDGNDTWEDDWDRKWNSSYDSKNADKANDIYKSLSNKEKYYLTAEKHSPRYINPGDYGENGKPSSNVYSLIEQYKDTPVSVIDIWQNEDKMGEVSIAVRNGKEYRHKGYASRALENGLKYFYNNPEMEYLIWGVNAKNRPSIELAKKYGFTFFEDVDGEWHTYVKDKEAKHNMAYNRWLSTEYLAHHGVKGQKWGEKNGPPYPLDSSISTGSKLIKGDGSPHGKKKYKTSEKTSHKRAERKARTDTDSAKQAAKNKKLSDARDNDMYDLDFLETVQNEEWYEKGDKKRMLKEYAEYLDDRDAYSQKGLPEELRKTGDEIRTEHFKTSFKQKYGRDFDENFVNDLSKFPAKRTFLTGRHVRDERQYKKQREFDSFMDNIPFSDGYTKAVKALNNYRKRVHYDNIGEVRLRSEREKLEKMNYEVVQEAYKMLGLDVDKLEPYSQRYISEAVRNAYWRRYKE